jgi:hypothetical protein
MLLLKNKKGGSIGILGRTGLSIIAYSRNGRVLIDLVGTLCNRNQTLKMFKVET